MERKKYEMGMSKGRFESRKGYANDLLGFIILFVLAGSVGIVMGMMQDYARDKILLSAGGTLVFGLGAWLFFLFLGRRKIGIEIFEDGFVFTNAKDQRIPCRWDEINEVYEKVVYRNAARQIGPMWGYTINLSNGKKINFFNSIENIHEFGALLQKKVSENRLALVKEAYYSGKTVSFGAGFSLNSQGVTFRRKTLSWKQIDAFKITRSNSLEIYEKGNKRFWATVFHKQIANFLLFREFLDKIIVSMPESEQPKMVRGNRNVK